MAEIGRRQITQALESEVVGWVERQCDTKFILRFGTLGRGQQLVAVLNMRVHQLLSRKFPSGGVFSILGFEVGGLLKQLECPLRVFFLEL